MYEYIIFTGEGGEKNRELMKEAITSTYGAKESTRFFSLVDDYRQEGLQEGKKEGVDETKVLIISCIFGVELV